MTQVVTAGAPTPVVPDAYIALIPPNASIIPGALYGVEGVVGTATWGPVGIAVPLGTNAQQLANFGPIQNRTYDLGTAVAVGIQQGATFFQCVRVTDGTDVAASATISQTGASIETATIGGTATAGDVITLTFTPSVGSAINVPYTVLSSDTPATMATALLALLVANTALQAAGFTFTKSSAVITYNIPGGTVTWTYSKSISGSATETVTLAATTATVTQLTASAKYTGSAGNNISIVLSTGTKAGTTKATVSISGLNIPAEIYDNISGLGNLFWIALANAINNGITAVRGPSGIITAAAGPSAGTPTNATTTLSGGTDGASGVTSATLCGTDTPPRKGMYSLRTLGCSVVCLADASDTTQWSAMDAFSDSEGLLIGGATPLGDTITSFATEVSSAGVDDFQFKAMLGDWCYWYDNVNQVTRLLSPVTFWAGLRAATPPQYSTLNKRVQAIVGTQKSQTGSAYSPSDIAQLVAARGDVICNPVPGGSYFGVRIGRNASSNATIRGENYTMLSNYIIASMAAVVGSIVGMLQNPTQRRQAKGMLDNFFATLQNQGIIGNAQGTQSWQVTLNATNNPPSQVAAGIEQINISVTYQSVIEFLLVNLTGGQTVTVTSQNVQSLSGS